MQKLYDRFTNEFKRRLIPSSLHCFQRSHEFYERKKLSFVLHFDSLGYMKQVFQNKFWLNEERNPGLMPVCVCVFFNFTIDRNWWNQKLTKLHGNQAPYNESLSVTEMRKTGKCYISDAFRIEISLLETDLAMQISHKDQFRQWRLAH